jgi:integrating conjugative element protein (TIGR03761 family)
VEINQVPKRKSKSTPKHDRSFSEPSPLRRRPNNVNPPQNSVSEFENLLKSTTFLKDSSSPFPDKYSIDKEHAFLADYIAAGADETNPLHERYIALVKRKSQFSAMFSQSDKQQTEKAEFTAEHIQNPTLTKEPIDSEGELMLLHTVSANRLFSGRGHKNDATFHPISSAQSTAGSLGFLWNQTKTDNPYVDWALIRYERVTSEIVATMEQHIDQMQQLIQQYFQHGIVLSIMGSENPVKLTLRFGSPYGFALATYVNRFDYFVRLQKTLAHKGLLADDVVRQNIKTTSQKFRQIWQATNRFKTLLYSSELKGLCRADFKETASIAGRKRIQTAREIFGLVPATIFDCRFQPMHSRRSYRLTEHELLELRAIGKRIEDMEKTQLAEKTR